VSSLSFSVAHGQSAARQGPLCHVSDPSQVPYFETLRHSLNLDTWVELCHWHVLCLSPSPVRETNLTRLRGRHEICRSRPSLQPPRSKHSKLSGHPDPSEPVISEWVGSAYPEMLYRTADDPLPPVPDSSGGLKAIEIPASEGSTTLQAEISLRSSRNLLSTRRSRVLRIVRVIRMVT
jgi:hypothetical protein